MFYLLVYSIVILIIYIITKNKYLRLFFSVVPPLLLSIMGGARNLDVGIDIGVYGNRYFALSSSYSSFKDVIFSSIDVEKGYFLLNWIVSQFTTNPHWFYFILTTIYTFLAFLIIYLLRNKLSVVLSIAIYLLTLWFVGLNLLRQSIAISLSGLAFALFFKGRYFRAVLVILIASLFHISALICLFFLFLWRLMDKYKKKKTSMFVLFLFSVFVLIIGYDSSILVWINNNFLNSDKFSTYITYTTLDDLLWFLSLILLFAVPSIISLIVILRNKVNIKIFNMFIIISMSSIYSPFQALNYVIFGRTSFYLFASFYLGVPLILQHERNTNVKKLLSVIYFFWGIVYFYIFVIMYEYGGISDYRSQILNIK